MIELRWYHRETNHQGSGETATIQIERVLQYREREGPREDGWWSEWKDVPEDRQ